MTRSGPIAKGSSATSMATAGDMAGSGAAGEEELGLKGAGLDTVRSSSPWAALLLAAGSTYQVSISSFIATPHFERKRRTHVPRAAAPSPHWLGFKLAAVLPAAPAKKKGKAKKKRDTPCALCGAAETPLWRTWPTDRRVALCNACGIQVRTLPPGAVLPELVYLPHPATATAATTAAGSELEQPVAPGQEIHPVKDSSGAALPKQVRVNLPAPAMAATRVVAELEQPRQQGIQESESESQPDSPILESMLDADIYLVKRTSPRRREKSPSPLPPPLTAEPEPAAAAPAPGNENDKQPETWCLHCGTTSTTQWRLGPAGERTLCNPCGVRYMRGGLVPEYRPKESPSFDVSVHSNMSRSVLQMRRNQVHPAPPAAYQRVRARRKRRRNGKAGQQQQQPAQVGKKRKKQNQPAAVEVLPVREKSKRIKAKEQHRQQPPQPAATQPPRAGNGMLLNLNLNLPPPPPPTLPNAGDGMEVDRHQLPAPPPELPQHTAGNMEMEEQDVPPPPLPLALPHAGGERMRDEEEPMPPPDPFLFDGPSAPMIIDDDDDEPVEVIVIDDD